MDPAAPTVGQVVQGQALAEGGNPNAPQESMGIKYRGDSNDPIEPKLNATLNAVEEHAAVVRKQWDERVAKEGKVFWRSPFDAPSTSNRFDTKELCQAYMDANHAAQIEAARLTGKPAAACEPVREVKSPKRTVADFYPPGSLGARTAHTQLAAQQAAKTTAQGAAALKSNGRAESRDVKSIHGPTYEALAQLSSSDIPSLKKLLRDAAIAGRNNVVRAVRKELISRGEKPGYM